MRWIVVAAVAVLAVSGCSGSDSGSDGSTSDSSAPDTVVASTEPRPGQVEAPPLEGDAEPADLEGAGEAVSSVRAKIPYPDSVVECLKTRAALNPDLLTDVNDLDGSADSLSAVMAASASCSQLVEAGPRFAEALQRTAGGTLSEEQLACVAAGYGGLDAATVAEVSGAVLNLGEADPAATAVIDEILVECGIDLEGGS